MPDRVFVDTNVLIYHLDAHDAAKQKRAEEWIRHLWSQRTGRLSFQVLSETYVTLTHKLHQPASDARTLVRSLLSWQPIPVDEQVVEAAWVIQDRYQLSWWDSLIIAAAQLTDCSRLLTEDLQHGQSLGGVTVVNPFQEAPP